MAKDEITVHLADLNEVKEALRLASERLTDAEAECERLRKALIALVAPR